MKKIIVYVSILFFVVIAVSTIIIPCASADYVTGMVTVEDVCSSNYINFSFDSDLTDVRLTKADIDFTGTNVKVEGLGSVCGASEPLIKSVSFSDQKLSVEFNLFIREKMQYSIYNSIDLI